MNCNRAITLQRNPLAGIELLKEKFSITIVVLDIEGERTGNYILSWGEVMR